MKKQFKFVYSFLEDEPPEALYVKSNNITNAQSVWKISKCANDTLLAIFCEDREIWKNPDIETGYRLDLIK